MIKVAYRGGGFMEQCLKNSSSKNCWSLPFLPLVGIGGGGEGGGRDRTIALQGEEKNINLENGRDHKKILHISIFHAPDKINCSCNFKTIIMII